MKTALLVLQFFPALIAAIKSLEEMFPVSGAGKEKIGIIREVVQATYDGANEILPALEKAVEVIVKAANTLGVFKK